MEKINKDSNKNVNDMESRLCTQIHHHSFNREHNNKRSITKQQDLSLPTIEKIVDSTTIIANTNENRDTKRVGSAVSRKNRESYELFTKQKIKGEITNVNELMKKSASKQKQRLQNYALFINPLKKMSELRLNPVAVKGRKRQMLNMPEFEKRRALKLQKRNYIQNKKFKRKFQNKKHILDDDIIQIVDSTDESDNSDVIIMPSSAPSIINIDDSDNDDFKKKTNATICDTNLVDSKNVNARQKQNSRSTSPCSILSANDFIELPDRSARSHLPIFENNSGSLNDTALLLLTISGENINKDYSTCTVNENAPKNDSANDANVLHKAGENDSSKRQFEDNLENVTSKRTEINEIDTDYEILDDDVQVSVKTPILKKKSKLLTKRKHQKNQPLPTSSDDDNDADSDNDNRGIVNDEELPKLRKRNTLIPHILRGPAVKDYSVKNRKMYNSKKGTNLYRNNKRPMMNSPSKMSFNDKQFVTTLNNLIQDDNKTNTSSFITDNSSEIDSVTENVSNVQEIGEAHSNKKNARTDLQQEATIIDIESAIPTTNNQRRDNRDDEGDNNDDSVQILNDNNNSMTTISDIQKDHLVNTFENGSPVYNVTFLQGKTVKYDGGIGWNDEMIKFYNNSWRGELFHLDRVLNKMNPDKNLWKIYSEDRFNKPVRRRLKCTNCFTFGHIRAKCKRPPKPVICFMCGDVGHHEPRCPNTICLRCGNKTDVFMKSCRACYSENRSTCTICKIRGHSINSCPDRWRRYHSTIEPNVYPNNGIKYNTKKYCCVCGGRGHLAENCRSAIRLMEYPIVVSTIKSHKKSYKDLEIKSPSSLSTSTSIGVNLMYKPYEEFQFKLPFNVEKDTAYGRFLSAVGMNHRHEHPPNQVHEVSGSDKLDTIMNKNNVNDHIAMSDISQVNNIVKETMNNNIVESRILKTGPKAFINENNRKSKMNENNNDNSLSIKHNNNEPDVTIIDSDSNYSFSDHFDVSSTSNVSDKNLKGNKLGESTSETTFNDFIPLMEIDDDSDYNDQANLDLPDADVQPSIPSVAKVYLTYFHSKYLLSPNGQKFLNTVANACNVTATIDFTSVSHVLKINGSHSDQEKFYEKLLQKYDELTKNAAKHQINCSTQSIPKKVDALIRFLRDNILQLYNNLGNCNGLFHRLAYLDKLHSKSGTKLADKTRRLLNMILLGQAGLCDGHKYLNKLIDNLKYLLNNNIKEFAPNEIRDDIIENWKMIFTPYDHHNYRELLQAYNELRNQGRLPKLNINPILLESDSSSANANMHCKTLVTYSGNDIKHDSKKTKSTVEYSNNKCNLNVQDQPTIINHNAKTYDKISNNVYTDPKEENPTRAAETVQDTKRPSTHWSNESVEYLEKCIGKVSNQPQLLQKLQRVLNKSKKGQLSYNDYIAVIKLHTALITK